MFERIFHHENTVLPSFISLASSVFISDPACLLLGRHRSTHFSFFLSRLAVCAWSVAEQFVNCSALFSASTWFAIGNTGLPPCLPVWFLAATAVSFSPVIPPRIWQSLFCNRLELQVPVGWRETKPEETDDGGKIEINPNSVWWSECFYLTLVVVKIIGKKSLCCAPEVSLMSARSGYTKILSLSLFWISVLYLRSRDMVLY